MGTLSFAHPTGVELGRQGLAAQRSGGIYTKQYQRVYATLLETELSNQPLPHLP